MTSRKSLVTCALPLLIGTVCCLGGRSWSQQPKAGGGDDKTGPTPLVYGVSACADCHSKERPTAASGPLADLCRLNETILWKDQDKHKDAYKNLLNERGKRMVQLLGIKDVATDFRCVSCHAMYVPPEKRKDPAITDPSYDVNDGVSCVACHGSYVDWYDLHGSRLQTKRKQWRSLSRQEKEQRYGMTDLWNPAHRAEKCDSCHIGNTKEGKVVTHDMYAAGHPPLPSFEVSTFSEAMPRHWQYPAEKSEEIQKILGFNPQEHERTKLTLIGGVTDFQETMNLLATQAVARAKDEDPEKRSLDLAQFDCYACHHELKRPSWRQVRGYSGKPGRPQYRQWPLALMRLAMHHAVEDAATFDKKLGELRDAFDAQPFGKLDAVASAAGDLATWCKQLQAKLNSANVKYDQEASKGLLRTLCQVSPNYLPDYETARQVAWTFRVIYDELKPKPSNDSQIEEKLKELNSVVQMNLPAGRKYDIQDLLPGTMKMINAYEPENFNRVFGELAKLVQQQQ